MRILILEDQERFAQILSASLREVGYVVDVVATVADFDAIAPSGGFDLMIVDLGLPDGDGLNAIRQYRKGGGNAPIIVVTARNKVSDLVQALDGGADDYMAKPFHIDVLTARMRTLLRRPRNIAARTHCVGQITLDQETGDIRFRDGVITLTPAERKLLALLMRRAGSVVSKTLIECQVNGADRSSTPNAVEQLVSRLRKSLAQSEAKVDVKTVRGVGYVLEERAN